MAVQSTTDDTAHTLLLGKVSVTTIGNSVGMVIPASLLQHTSLDRGTELFAYVDRENETLTYVDSKTPWEADEGEFLGTYTIHDVGNSRGLSIPADVVEADLVSTDDDLLVRWDHDERHLVYQPDDSAALFEDE